MTAGENTPAPSEAQGALRALLGAGGAEVTSLAFTRSPVVGRCPVPIEPAIGASTDVDGHPLPLAERTLTCGNDACWLIGALPCCDFHCCEACELMGIDYYDLAAEAERASA